MSFRKADIPGTTWVLPVLALVTAVLAGMVTAAVGSRADYRAIYYVAVFALGVLGCVVAVTRTEPLRFAFLALIVCFPIAAEVVPPGRFGITVFDVVMLTLTIGLIGEKLLGPSTAGGPLFPTGSLLIAWLLAVPCVVFSQFPLSSLLVLGLSFTVYVFFLFTLDELRREGGFERLVLLLSIVSLVMAAGLLIDHFLHVNLTLRGRNLNQMTYLVGADIRRAGGFFQDPQKSGAFLACIITFLLLLSIRDRFHGAKMRFVVWAAVGAGLAALITTISRSAILACLSVSGLALLAFNGWNVAAKLAIAGSTAVLATVMALMPAETWLNIVPPAVSARFATMSEDLEIRRNIWFDTWDMFADHPLTGIGPGSFRSYLIETRPNVFNYYGIGTQEGVAYIPDQPESGYLKIFYEGGIIGSIAVLLAIGDAIRRAFAVIAGMDAGARIEGIAALAGLVTFGATFVTLFTMTDPRIGGILAFLLAVIWHRSLQRAQVTSKA
ncbi:MAG: O-antigen ligase family protein [Burkholderiales bacterium]